jgi:hypothetical protein
VLASAVPDRPAIANPNESTTDAGYLITSPLLASLCNQQARQAAGITRGCIAARADSARARGFSAPLALPFQYLRDTFLRFPTAFG